MNLKDRILKAAAKTVLEISEVDDATKAERRAVCDACQFRDIESDRCKICKCYLAVKTGCAENWNPKKMRVEVTHCPNGFWNDTDTANYYRQLDGLPPITLTHAQLDND